MRWPLLLLVPAALAAGCGASKKAAPTTTAVSTAPVVTEPELTPTTDLHPATGKVIVKVTGATHAPVPLEPWHYSVRVTSNGKPASARLYLQILASGATIGTLGTHLVNDGKWAETISWPANTSGKVLVLSAQAVSSGRIGTGEFVVKVQ